MKTTIPTEMTSAMPSAGATQPAGKSSMPDAVLGRHATKTESVTDAAEVKGAARKAIDKQLENDGGVAWNVRNTDNNSSDDNDK